MMKKNAGIFLCVWTLVYTGVLFSRADIIFDTKYIGNAGNSPDSNGIGSVNYDYLIGTYEVTVAQYAEFLNAKASTDYYGLYSDSMETCPLGASIIRSGESGSYTYTTVAGKENEPVRWVSLYDCMRFCNWLYNGQGNGDTEYGSYDLTDGYDASRLSDATWVIPTEDEWYKAAYYDPVNGCYYDYPNSSDEVPEEPTDGTTPREMNFGDYPYWAPDGTWIYFTSTGETTGYSPYGVYDMGGNVEEWTETMCPKPYDYYRVTRGGDIMSLEDQLRSSDSSIYEPDMEGAGFGFRVACLIPEPASAVMLAIGLFMLRLFHRKGRR